MGQSNGFTLTPATALFDEERKRIEAAAVPLIVALDRYCAAHGCYPESLETLVPAYLPNLPHCLHRSAGAGTSYQVDAATGQYHLICGIGSFSERHYRSSASRMHTRPPARPDHHA